MGKISGMIFVMISSSELPDPIGYPGILSTQTPSKTICFLEIGVFPT